MYTMRSMDEEDPSILDPIFRRIDFSDTAVIRLVTTFLRLAWTQTPPEALADHVADDDYIRPWLCLLPDMSEEALAATATDDTDTLDTPLRGKITDLWGHVYSDTARFLGEASPYCGEMEGRTSLPLAFGASGDKGSPVVADHVFECNVLVIPTFIAKGASVRITRNRVNQDVEGEKEKQKETELGVFDLEVNPWEIFFLRRGFEYNFYVDGGEASAGKTVGAVLAVCELELGEEASDDEDGPGDKVHEE